MEMIKVNTMKLKIILTPKDMAEFNITNDCLDYSTEKSRKVLKCILEKAKTDADFDTGQDRLYMQFFPSVDGGGELYITRKPIVLPQDTDKETRIYKNKYSIKSKLVKNDGYIISFESSENLIALCIRLGKEQIYVSSSLYFYEGKYYLYIHSINTFSKLSKDFDLFDLDSNASFICEYGKTYYASKIRKAFLDEHAKLICRFGAVETFCQIFS